jgi:hypothetical protein
MVQAHLSNSRIMKWPTKSTLATRIAATNIQKNACVQVMWVIKQIGVKNKMENILWQTTQVKPR